MKASVYLFLLFASVYCKKEDYNASLLVARGQDISIIKNFDEVDTIVKTKDARQLDFDFKNQMIFWYDFAEKTIYRAQLSKRNKEVVIRDLELSDLAFDWIYSHIYWTNTKIEVANLDGTKRKVVKDSTIHQRKPIGIAIDPAVGWLFYLSQAENSLALVKMGMDGTGGWSASRSLSWLNAVLTVDVVDRRVFYIGVGIEIYNIFSLDYYFRNVEEFNEDHALAPYAISKLFDKMYYTDKGLNVTQRASVIPHVRPIKHVEWASDKQTMKLYGLKIYDASKQPKSVNYCSTIAKYGSCPELCLPHPEGKKEETECTCPSQYHLLPNGLMCIKDDAKEPAETDEYLLCGFSKNILNISISTYKMNYKLSFKNPIRSVDFHFLKNELFWADGAKIFKAKIYTPQDHIPIIKSNGLFIDVIAVDWVYNNIYWSSPAQGAIGVSNFNDTLYKFLVMTTKNSTLGLAVDPLKGWIFWTDSKSSTIWKAGADGSDKSLLVNEGIPCDITINFDDNRIYWTDSTLNIIKSCNYKGSDLLLVLQLTEQPFCITTFKGWIYWTVNDQILLFKADIKNTTNIQPVSALLGRTNWPAGLSVYHQSKQPAGVNHCDSLKMKCSHLCLPAPKKPGSDHQEVSCVCPENYRMLPNGFTCTEDAYSDKCDRPYVVEVRAYNSNFRGYLQCSGTVITDRWIITAASCVNDTNHTRYIKIFEKPGSDENPWDVLRMVIYPQFRESSIFEDDVALLKIAQRAKQNKILPMKSGDWADPKIVEDNDMVAVSRNYCEDKRVLPNTYFSICGVQYPVTNADSQLCKGGPLIRNGIQIGILSKVIDIDEYHFTIFSGQAYKDFIFNYTANHRGRVIYTRPLFNSRVRSMRLGK